MDPVFIEAQPVSSGRDPVRPWQYLSIPGYEILSKCSDAFNEGYVHALQRANEARLALIPEAFWGEPATPIKIILYNRPPEQMATMRRSPIDLSWTAEEGGIVGLDAFEVSHPLTLGDGDTFINCGNYWATQPERGDFSVDVDSAVLLSVRVPRLPAWFAEGLEGTRGIFPNRVIRSSLSGDTVVYPNALWTSAGETRAIQDEEARAAKEPGVRHPRELLPLGDLFRGAYSESNSNLWKAESALFVRWGLFGSGDRQAFLDFVGESARRPLTEKSFQDHFHMGFSEAQRRLGDYLFEAVGRTIVVPLPGQPKQKFDFRDATSTEVARMVGDWGRLEGRSTDPQDLEFRQDCLDQADRLYERTFARKEQDPLFLAAFGLFEVQREDTGRARMALETAVGSGIVHPRAYVELARLRLGMILSGFQEGIGDLNQPDYDEILGYLETARAQMPGLLSGYFVYARALEHAPRKPTLADFGVLENALQLFPQNAALAYKVATLYRSFGYPDEAKAVVRRAMEFSESDADRARLSGFLSQEASLPKS